MSYTPTEWQTGDIVTADKLNKLENGAEDMNMSYTPTEWANGDIVTAEKLNKLENGVAAGGGGRSDFTTAEVTITNNASNPIRIFAPVAIVEDEFRASGSIISVNSKETVNSTVILNGLAYGTLITYGGLSLSTTGNIEYDSGNFMITGNGTITISEAQ